MSDIKVNLTEVYLLLGYLSIRTQEVSLFSFRFSNLVSTGNAEKMLTLQDKVKVCRLPGSSFTEESQKQNDDVIMTSFYTFGIQTFNILLNWL